tara:strand:- start:62 stop:268 length:207 start_codon:yes stop_codon:yes gene_type:complete
MKEDKKPKAKKAAVETFKSVKAAVAHLEKIGFEPSWGTRYLGSDRQSVKNALNLLNKEGVVFTSSKTK